MSNIEIVGVQMHIGSQITDAKPFASAIEKVAPLVRELKSKYAIKFFSIGGGMGIIYRRALEERIRQMVARSWRRTSAFSVRITLTQLCRRYATWAFGFLSSLAVFLSATPAFCSRAFVTYKRNR
jgi:hypothetical protein